MKAQPLSLAPTRLRTALVGSFASLTLASVLPAVVVASYNFDERDATSPTNEGREASFVSPTFISSATAVTPGASYGTFAVQNETDDDGLAAYGANQPVLRLSRAGGSATLESALTNNSYFSITLTPTDLISFTDLTFNASKGGDSERGIAVYSDAVTAPGSFTTSNALFSVSNLQTIRNPNFASPDAFFEVDLTGPEFQDVNDPITFYFYTFTTGDTGTLEIDNIVFNAVPEPGAALLAGLGLMSLLVRRKR